MAINVEHLIECVKKHVYLYDLGHKDYKNTTRKAAIWENIADQLNENSETVKLKWKTVRDGYIKFRKQQKEGNKKVINYIWSAQLKFLDDYQVSRKSKSANVSLSSTLELSEDESETPSQSNSPTSLVSPPPGSSPSLKSQSSRRKRKGHDQEKNLNHLRNKKTKKDVEIYDATDHLFLSYSQTFKTFSLREQALLKVELAKLFSNAELNSIDNSKTLQESLVAGSSPKYASTKRCDNTTYGSGDIYTVEVDDDESNEEIEFVLPMQSNNGRRSRRNRTPSDTTP